MMKNYILRVALAGTLLALAGPIGAQAHPGHAQAIPFLQIPNEPPPTLDVDQPVPEALRRGAVIIPYRTQNFRILPVFGASATDVSPRAGHLHVTLDGLPWRWADAGDNNAVVIVGLPSGQHNVLIELATPEHKVLLGKLVTFVVPAAQ